MRDLKRTEQTLVKKLVWRQPRNILACHCDPAGCWGKNARDHIEKSGFSGTIRPNEPGDRAFFDPHGRPVHRAKTTEMLVNIVNNDHC